jgi:enterochelin esterase-like enzyme
MVNVMVHRCPGRRRDRGSPSPADRAGHAGAPELTGRWRRNLWRAVAGGTVLAAAVTGCSAGGDPQPDGGQAAVSTVVTGSGSQGAVEHVTDTDSSFGVYGDYSIYLPPGYGQDPQRRYPVVYLLHGATDSDSFFLDLGIREAMDSALASGAVGPMILVLPDGGPKFTGDGNVPTSFDDYVASELIPAVDRRLRTVPDRTGRAIGGISLGGRHALVIAADQPSLVAAAGGHSSTVTRSPDQLAARLAAADIPIYLDAGESDGLFDDDEAFAGSLRRRGADVRWNPAEGEHARPYWTAHLPDYLRFYSDALGAGGG